MFRQNINKKLGTIKGIDGDITEINTSIDMRKKENREEKKETKNFFIK